MPIHLKMENLRQELLVLLSSSLQNSESQMFELLRLLFDFWATYSFLCLCPLSPNIAGVKYILIL